MNINHAPKTVYKNWGKETWHVLSADFCVKTISILAGHKTSYQYHVQKEEINFIECGEAEVILEDGAGVIQSYQLRAGDSFFVPAGRKHRVTALSDLTMFEVSNKFVDDVIRLEDDFNRPNGRIEAEHQVPAVLIMAAGLGTRLKHHTAHKHKALVPVGTEAAISHVISKFPIEYEIVVATGYQADSLEEYCLLAHPDRRFRFVRVTGWDDPKTDPGHSVWQCRDLLQRPFFLAAPDSLIQILPHMEGNWLGVYPTDACDKYATVQVMDGTVTAIANKGPLGFDHAFIGWAAVYDYQTFWTQLDRAAGHELVAAWKDVAVYPNLTAKVIPWFDVGNLDDLAVARRHYGDPIGSPKSLDEVTYLVGGRVLKFHPDPQVSRNRFLSGTRLGHLAPPGLTAGAHFIAYDWKAGKDLYGCSATIRSAFLDQLGRVFTESVRRRLEIFEINSFYRDKTQARADLFRTRFGAHYFSTAFNINGVKHRPLEELLGGLDYRTFSTGTFYSGFHGDLHFDNVIYDGTGFTYLDWRESFAGSVDGGDIYYDLGKLYAGILLNFNLLKTDVSVDLQEGAFTLMYHHPIDMSLADFKIVYENWLQAHGFDLTRVKTIAGLAYLNIAPLHGPVWGKILLVKAIELLDEVTV